MSDRRRFLSRLAPLVGAALTLPQLSAARRPAPSQNPAPVDPPLRAKVREALYAFVVADAMGGSIENKLPDEIEAQFAAWDFTTFLPPTAKGDIKSGLGKGNGRTTDDTLNLEAVIGVYLRHRDHVDAYDYARHYIDIIEKEKVWIAEKGAELTPHERPLWWPERYVYQRLVINAAEPRQAGIGNYLNEGFQGNALPVGAVNVGDPQRAYDEITAFGQAHTESYALEAAGGNAAAYAVAFERGSTTERVIEAALAFTQDGTRAALTEVLATVTPTDSLRQFAARARAAVLPYLQLGPELARSSADPLTPKSLRAGTNIARPSRIACIENFPVALAALRYGQGDYLRTLKAALFYGRDAETIAAVATSLLAAVRAPEAIVPDGLKHQLDQVNRRDYAALADRLTAVVAEVHRRDAERQARRAQVLSL